MNHQGQAAFLRRCDVGGEDPGLDVPGRQVVVEVEAGLADTHHLRRVDQFDEASEAILGIVWVEADGGPHAVVAIGDVDGTLRGVEVGADHDHLLHARLTRLRNRHSIVALHLVVVDMAVRVDPGGSRHRIHLRGKSGSPLVTFVPPGYPPQATS